MHVSIFAMMALIASMLTSCGQDARSHEEPVLVELPQNLIKQHGDALRSSNFILDHGQNKPMVRGYLTPTALQDLPAHLVEHMERIEDESAAVPGDGYHDYDDLTAWLENFAEDHAQLVSLHSAGRSVENRELWYVKISDHVERDEDEPKLLYIANMHGNETAGRELMLYLIEELIELYKNNDPATVQLINHSQIYIMPSMNPDGFEDGQRWNSRYKDLNRDFPDFSSDPHLRLEERQPETQAVIRLHQEHHFQLAINYHGGAVCFNLPWDTVPNREPQDMFGDDLVISTYGRQYARSNPLMYASGQFPDGMTYGYEWYEVDGGLQDWANYYANSIHATVELSNTKYPRANQLENIWLENRTSMLEFLQNGLAGIHLSVKDAHDAPISSAVVSLESSSRIMQFSRSQLSRPSLQGLQKVRVEAQGFRPVEIELEAVPFDGRFQEVKLEANR